MFKAKESLVRSNTAETGRHARRDQGHAPTSRLTPCAAPAQYNKVHRTRELISEGLHPYHFSKVHALQENDAPVRIGFCQWLIQNPNLNILWTDEATFTRVGLFNQRNEHF